LRGWWGYLWNLHQDRFYFLKHSFRWDRLASTHAIAGRKKAALPFRVSCKVCAKAASLWLSWFFPVFSPAEGGKARWRLTSIRSFIPTWGGGGGKVNAMQAGHRRSEQNHEPLPSTFGSKSRRLGLTSLSMWRVLVGLVFGGRQGTCFAAPSATTCCPFSSGETGLHTQTAAFRHGCRNKPAAYGNQFMQNQLLISYK